MAYNQGPYQQPPRNYPPQQSQQQMPPMQNRPPPQRHYDQQSYNQEPHYGHPGHESYVGYDIDGFWDQYAGSGDDQQYQNNDPRYNDQYSQRGPPGPPRGGFNGGPPRGGYGPAPGRPPRPSAAGQNGYQQGYGPGPIRDPNGYYGPGPNGPPRQRPVGPPGPPKPMGDNPFPQMNTPGARTRQSETETLERGMGGMDLNGRPSYDAQRPGTANSRTSSKSNGPDYGVDPRSFARPPPQDPYARGPPQHFEGRQPFDPRGPPSRAMTMPNEADQGWQRGGGDPFPPSGRRDPIEQRSYTTLGTRDDMHAMPPRSQSSMGSRPPPNGAYGPGPGQFRGPAPPRLQTGVAPVVGPSSAAPRMYNPAPPASNLDEYMPNFDAAPTSAPPVVDHIGLPLDVGSGIPRPPTRSDTDPPFGSGPGPGQQVRGAKSQPDLRGGPPAPYYGAPPGAPAMPKAPPLVPGSLRGPPGPNVMPGPMHSPTAHKFHRPGAPPMSRAGEPGYSDPGPMRAQAGRGAPPPGAPVPGANPDALPAHPTPVRPGLMQESAKPSRGYGEVNASLPPNNGSVSSFEEKRKSAPVSHNELHRLRAELKERPDDHALELALAKKLVEASRVLVDESGDVRARTKAREQFIFEAHRHVKKLVGHNYPEAIFYLADCYGTGGLGLAEDAKEAFALYQSAAKLGHGPSAYRTAVCCEMGSENGGGTRRDPLKAVQWYRRAAHLGEVGAMYKLGMISLKGHLGQPASVGEAVSWLQRAAQQADADNPHALHELACLYENAPPGGRLIRDEGYARELYTKAAGWKYRLSQARLGRAYEYGEIGCPVDNRLSIYWYTKAAAQRDHEAELALAGWYLTGAAGILEQSDAEAYLWARRAAMSELPKAEFAMGYFSEGGIGCPADVEDAMRWYGRAATHGYPKAQERLEELKRGGRSVMRGRERHSRSDRKNGDDCMIM
ncbi:hypothetical protein EJ06DRAFT_553255 [Trichodelitschia bisporula]|uniref:HCP-like protein n=1 Tax=Trichodelitschia bisporula TaxID=703511 RepID=A0A6G1I7T8_9PEZI|nr:hypothetical protein EJ06DRAFT_553255 [Trichodelitschia bisporula]